MRALVLSVAMLMSAAAAAQDLQQLQRPPPPGQGYGPGTQAPPAPVQNAPIYDTARPGGRMVVVDREEVEARMARMQELLERAFDRNDRGNSAKNALRKLNDEMAALRQHVASAPDVRDYRVPRPPPPAPPPVLTVQPVTEDQLQRINKAVARESFGEEKVRVLESAASSQYFLVPQVLTLLKQFTFADDRLAAVRVLWPRVLDRENAFQLYGAFKFSSEKEKLRQVIGG